MTSIRGRSSLFGFSHFPLVEVTVPLFETEVEAAKAAAQVSEDKLNSGSTTWQRLAVLFQLSGIPAM